MLLRDNTYHGWNSLVLVVAGVASCIDQQHCVSGYGQIRCHRTASRSRTDDDVIILRGVYVASFADEGIMKALVVPRNPWLRPMTKFSFTIQRARRIFGLHTAQDLPEVT